ncbi:MAG: hypothetical protein ACJ71M_05980 [Nitrososphaeraceae archaeon]
MVRYALKYSAKNGHMPIEYGTLKLKNIVLYSMFGSMSSMFGENSLNYYCMSCGTKHKKAACPKCGSKMKRVGS